MVLVSARGPIEQDLHENHCYFSPIGFAQQIPSFYYIYLIFYIFYMFFIVFNTPLKEAAYMYCEMYTTSFF